MLVAFASILVAVLNPDFHCDKSYPSAILYKCIINARHCTTPVPARMLHFQSFQICY